MSYGYYYNAFSKGCQGPYFLFSENFLKIGDALLPAKVEMRRKKISIPGFLVQI